MRWRAMYRGGGIPAAHEDTGYVPLPTGSKYSINLYGEASKNTYRVDIMDPLNVGDPVKVIARSGSRYVLRDAGLWEAEMWPGGLTTDGASPPFRGSPNKLGSEFNPPHTPADAYDWQHLASTPTGMTPAEVTAACWTRNFYENVNGGSNLWEVIRSELEWIASNTQFRVGQSKEVYLLFAASDLPRISLTINTMSDSDDMPDHYFTQDGLFRFWTPAAMSDLACFATISIGLQNGGPAGLIYYGYGTRYGQAQTTYAPGISGFSQYGTPRFYLLLLPNGNVTLATNTINNSNNGAASSQWPYVGGWNSGFNPTNYGIELMPGIPGDGDKREQYRVKGWAVMRNG